MTRLLALFTLAALIETTILNTSVLEVDRTKGTITIPAAPGAGGEVRTRRLVVAASARASLAKVRAGTPVLLTLHDDTVVAIAISGPPSPRGTQQAIPQLPPAAATPTNRGIPQLPAGVDPPQARPIPQVPPVAGVTPSPGVSPVSVAPTRPAVSPVAVRSPRSPGTPRPVVLPSDPPPSPAS